MFNLFKKKEMAEQPKGNMTQEMFLKVMRELISYTNKDVIKINLSNDDCTIFDSKFGGLPYLGQDDVVPVSVDNQQLRLIGQINLADLPENSYQLETGLLQFWALNNDLYGLDFDDMTSQKESRVIYYPKIDQMVTESQIIEKYHPLDDGYFPIVDTFKLHFIATQEGMSTGDYHFEELFKQEWNKLYPDNIIESYYDLPDEIIYDDEFNNYSGFGHKLFGYPAFTQEDPRNDESYDDYVLLLQIDSIGAGDKEIMWGDSGICNFFITKKDLENMDFSKVLYNWDCY